MNAPIGIRRQDERLEPIDISHKAAKAFSDEAAFRKASYGALVGQILEAVARHDLFGEILEREGGRG